MSSKRFRLAGAPSGATLPRPIATSAHPSPDTPAQYFPNVVLRTQEGRRVRFYDDLIRDKIVLINFFYTSCRAICERATANLLKVEQGLGAHLGRDVVMVSVTIDPGTDTPGVLKTYSLRYGTRPGWYFVTGNRTDLDLIRQRLGTRDRDDPARTHTALLVYGNAATGQWAATPAMADPRTILRSVMRLVDLAMRQRNPRSG
jgi:protein SCO1/2